MDAPEDANPIAPPSPSHSEESLFRYIEQLPPIKLDTYYTPFSDALKPDVPFERGLQIRSCEAGASYTDYSPYQDSSELTDDQANSALFEQLNRSLLSEIEGPRCDLESLNPINIADLPKGQSTLENLHSAVDYSQHEIRYQNSKPKAAIETELMQGNLGNFATVASNPNEVLPINSVEYEEGLLLKHSCLCVLKQIMLRRSSDYDLDLYPQDIWINQNRRKRAPLGEGAGCKNCKCKKANCLKRYCKCFASGEYCTGSCSCQNCYNRPTHEDKVIVARKVSETHNHLAFASKVNTDSLSENGVDPSKTPASTGRIRGCNCKKSKCKKSYCECYENGVPCSINCRCTGCNNPYSCYSELGPEIGTQINESCETLMAENVSHSNSTASSPPLSRADSSNALLGGSSKRERPSNFDIPDASGFDASRRIKETINILCNQLNFDEDNLESSPELPCINNSSNRVGEIIHYYSSLVIPSATSLQHLTPDANPTVPGNFSQHRE
ncbi:hypothetical protein K1719_005658 [Acacia pycnantha]|nr:hypothetical protein K1719_005658 [Acacia pycnantha]